MYNQYTCQSQSSDDARVVWNAETISNSEYKLIVILQPLGTDVIILMQFIYMGTAVSMAHTGGGGGGGGGSPALGSRSWTA